jgi:hypothetical protein
VSIVCPIVTFLWIGSKPMLSVRTASAVGGELNMVLVPEMVCAVIVRSKTQTKTLAYTRRTCLFSQSRFCQMKCIRSIFPWWR